jgi:transcription elongation factor GreA
VDVSDESASAKAEKKAYRIVGELEANLKNNEISIASPLAQSLVNKAVGDVVMVSLPRGEKYYEIQSISYI